MNEEIEQLRKTLVETIAISDDWRMRCESSIKDCTKALDQRDAALAREAELVRSEAEFMNQRDEALAQLKHHEAYRYLADCFDEELPPDKWASLSDNELMEQTEYYEKCKCFICQWTRYELARREQMIRIVEQRDAALALAEQRRVEIERLSWKEITPETLWEPHTEIGMWIDKWEGKPAHWFSTLWNQNAPAYWIEKDYTHYRRLNAPHTTEGKETK